MNRRTESRRRLRKFAEEIVLYADTVRLLLKKRPDFTPTGILDPEDWTIMRHHAKQILNAIEADSDIDPAWIDAIATTAAVWEMESLN